MNKVKMSSSANRSAPFYSKEAFGILIQIQAGTQSIVEKIPLYPEENNVYFMIVHKEDYRRDGYVYQSHATNKTLNLIRTYNKIQGNGFWFQRIIIKLRNPSNPAKQPVIISYLGNHLAYQIRPH